MEFSNDQLGAFPLGLFSFGFGAFLDFSFTSDGGDIGISGSAEASFGFLIEECKTIIGEPLAIPSFVPCVVAEKRIERCAEVRLVSPTSISGANYRNFNHKFSGRSVLSKNPIRKKQAILSPIIACRQNFAVRSENGKLVFVQGFDKTKIKPRNLTRR